MPVKMKNLSFAVLVFALLSFGIMQNEYFTSSQSINSDTNLISNQFTPSPQLRPNLLEDEYTPLKDLSQMFDERGYVKSNGFSFDEQEIISDFNGNLIYDIPLYNFNMANNMNFDVRLTYNGSVAHTLFMGTTTTYDNNLAKYNINSPEWILSVNGIAIQVFNFETKFFTNSSGPTTISGNNLHKLIPGYHFTDRLKAAGNDNDRINILAGDGSLITLVNTAAGSAVGNYVYEGKDLYYKANVYYTESNDFEWYRNRRMELMKGDGNVYIFEEYKIEFEDFLFDALVSESRKVQLMRLEEIVDQFGNKVEIAYDAELPVGGTRFGRPFCSSLATKPSTKGISFYYGNSIFKVDNFSSVNGSYTFYFNV